MLITGAVRAPDLPPGARITRAYNSIYVIDHDGIVLSVYDKLHLVPFGEYLPFQDLMEKLGFVQLTKVQGGFIPGDAAPRDGDAERAARAAADLLRERFFLASCVPRDDRPGWIINLTNDGWFGIRPAPTSICSRRGCARSSKACRWCAQPTPAFPRSSIPRDALSHVSGSASKAYWMPACRPPCRRRFTRALAIFRPRS